MPKIIIDIPQDFYDYVQSAAFGDKPFDLCVRCPFDTKTCDGPASEKMSGERWAEVTSARAKREKISHARIAEEAFISKSTVDNALSGRTKDIRHSTMRAINQVITGRKGGKYPCHLAALLIEGKNYEVLKEEEHAEAEEVRKAERVKIDHLTEEVQHLRDECISQRKTIHSLWAMLEKQKNE